MTSKCRGLIAGIGNSFRGDDAAGPISVRQLRGRVPAGVSLIEEIGEPLALIEAWKDAAIVILIDAVSSGAAPGTIHRFEEIASRSIKPVFRSSTHAFGVPEVIDLARVLGRLPPMLLLYGIEGKTFEAGEELSAEVRLSIDDLVKRVEEDLGNWIKEQRVWATSIRMGIRREAKMREEQ